MNKRGKRQYLKLILIDISVLLIIILCVKYYSSSIRGIVNNIDKTVSKELSINDETEIHFLNTGNSDSILIKGDKTIVIDGADNNDENMITTYLKKEGVEDIDYLISTHNHKDHLGSLDKIVKEFNVKKVFVSSGKSDIKTYKDFRSALTKKGLTPVVPVEGGKIILSDDSYMQIFNTSGGTYTNDESLVTLYVHNNDKILFAADAEKLTEKRILKDMVKVDLLKIGHHGSSSSTTEEFLDILKPKYAVITVSEDNKFANPAKVVMERLEKREIDVYRTDECGHIVFRSTGDGLKTESPKGSYNYRTVQQAK
ncbi:ComEC/Rec2 family competence protein [Clostridium mediterraneense]|uniref:ComEC/Rec2 family competence protein n=1 Tax=Clostridium mediterraneense TaxID=1805472 RepID=UPI000830D2E5|nr:MBL fold metallo-hydrolase [Clostridium mediterraneense]